MQKIVQENLKKIFNLRNLLVFILLSFLISCVYVSFRIAVAPTVAPTSDITVRVKGDYTLMLVQCILGVVALVLPNILNRKLKLSVPSFMIIMYAVFLYCSIFLGEVRSFYYKIPYWDTLLHVFSGVALGALGFSVVSLFNKSHTVTFRLSPAFVAVFAFCFAMALGTIWEIYEFSIDSILATNTQKYALENGEELVGREALVDTMKDLIVDTIGAGTISIVGYMSLKNRKGWLDRFKIKRN